MQKGPTNKLLVRTFFSVACLAFCIGFKNDPSLAVSPAILMTLIAPELTPFFTATALLFTLSATHSLYTVWYLFMQLSLILLGGALERLILSTYGTKELGQDQSLWFWLGGPL